MWIVAAAMTMGSLAYGQDSGASQFQAIRTNDLASLKNYLSTAGDVNARDSHGNTLLMQAAAYGSTEAVALLLDRGADVNGKNPFDATALLWAAADPKKARLLIAKGADVKAQSKQGRTPLMVAATCDGCMETVRLLISKGADVNARDVRGGTALDAAAQANDMETIQLLIEKGADPAAADAAHFTPLMASASHCNLPAIRLMLAKGADVNAANTFAGAVKFGPIQIIHMTPLMFAASYCSTEVVKTLLDAGAKINEKDSRNMTPLMFAVTSEDQKPAVVKLLLNAGANVNAKSTMGETALDWAAKFGNREVLTTLTAAGALAGDPFTAPVRKAGAARTASQAAESAVAILQQSSAEFFKQSGCFGCHHQPIAAMATAAARAAGLKLDPEADQQALGVIRTLELGGQEAHLERVAGGGFTDPPAYALLALSTAKVEADADSDATAIYLAGAQHRDGTWRIVGSPRAPIQEGVIGRSVIAGRAIQMYCPPARKAEFDERLARLRDWLLEAKAATNDDYAMQTLGLRWTGASAAKTRSVGAALIARQRDDGGWAQNSNLSSDAYATGESLWALREAGVLTAGDPVYKRGVQFLLNTQWEDGSWYVRSRAVKLQPYFQSGFPYNHDQWISSTATGFAAMALAAAASSSELAAKE
ncbi:MAG: ankyrin repeat domain-containing protein [Acidobacteriota bacterium]|nr:ankyrin repeat domain-containing protein [Acidobacteriota bacterium]